MIVNVDNIDGNEKAIARKENVKVTYIKDYSKVFMFLS